MSCICIINSSETSIRAPLPYWRGILQYAWIPAPVDAVPCLSDCLMGQEISNDKTMVSLFGVQSVRIACIGVPSTGLSSLRPVRGTRCPAATGVTPRAACTADAHRGRWLQTGAFYGSKWSRLPRIHVIWFCNEIGHTMRCAVISRATKSKRRLVAVDICILFDITTRCLAQPILHPVEHWWNIFGKVANYQGYRRW